MKRLLKTSGLQFSWGFAFILCFSFHSIAQTTEKCAFDRLVKQQKDNPVYQQNRNRFEQFVKEYAQQAEERSGGGTTTIPCVVHIVHTGQAAGVGTSTGANPSNAQINSAITDMNDAFGHKGVYDTPAKNGTYDAATDVQFVLAKTAPDGSATTGINRYDVVAMGKSWANTYKAGGMDAGEGGGVLQATIIKDLGFWPPSDYLNIWVVHEIENQMTTLGFASFPNMNSGSTDGMTMLASAFGYDPENDDNFLLNPATNLNGTANHEVGHYLNLYHSFEGDVENPAACPTNTGNGCGNDVGDCCEDVPAHKRSSGCPTDDEEGNSCVTDDGPNSYIHNFMDYADDACFHGFSNDQKTRMEASLAGPRKSFCTAISDNSPSGTYPAMTATATVTDPSQTMGIYSVTLNGTTFTSLSSYHDGGYLNRVASQPTVSLSHASPYSITIRVGVGNTENDELVAVFADYNNDGDFDDAGEKVGEVAPGDGKKNGASHSLSFTTPASGAAVTGQRLRLRIVSDFDNGDDPISSATSVSEGGQIEDYSIRLESLLPVNLTSFEVQPYNNEEVKIHWTTSTENNSSYFEVERSIDGEQFKSLKKVSSSGYSNTIQNYGIVDKQPFKGINYYRLKQVDTDGTVTFSAIQMANMSMAGEIIIYPNPAKDFIMVSGLANKNYQVRIYNQLGKLVEKIQANSSTLDINSLQNGVYYFEFSTAGKNYRKKVVIY